MKMKSYGQGKSPLTFRDDKKTKKKIKSYIKENMDKQSDADLMSNVRKMSDNKTEYNWNTTTKEVEAHDKNKR